MRKIFYLVLSIFLFTGCEDLDIQPLNTIGAENVFNDVGLLQAYVNNLQGRLPYGIHGGSGYGHYPCMLASISDEARAKSGWVQNNSVIIKGTLRPTNSGGLGLWSSSYRTIKIANDILLGLETSTLDAETTAKYAGMAKYIRAFSYLDLVRRYGDIPLIKAPQTPADDLLVSRTSKSEVYDFINEDLNAAELALDNKSDEVAGAINKQAAIALNSRAMLYAQRWGIASVLADKLITGGAHDGLSLHSNYRDLMLSIGGATGVIMEKLTSVPNTGHSFGLYNWPVRWRSDWGGQTDPTQQMVDSYQMAATGLSITDPTSGYDPAKPYDGRDSRFYASIFYHGSEFSVVSPSQGLPFIDMEYGNKMEGPGPGHHGAASVTGYLVKKFADPADGFSPKKNESTSSWKEIRYAEVLLNYAEAENESNGPSIKIYNAINEIRMRAGIPNLVTGLDKQQMRNAIRQERKVELAFENHRYFDLIRWGIAEDVLNGFKPKGVKITRKASAPSRSEEPQLFDAAMLNFDLDWTLDVNRNQVFPPSNNLLPIPQSEMDKNPNLAPNNPGY